MRSNSGVFESEDSGSIEFCLPHPISLRSRIALTLSFAVIATAQAPASQCVELADDVFGVGATLCVDPETISVASIGTVTFTLTVGGSGFAQDGLVQIEFPSGGRGMFRPQSQTPGSLGYISGSTTRPGASIQCTVPDTNVSQFQLLGGNLNAGDQIVMTYYTDMPKVGGTIYWRIRTDRDADLIFEPDNIGGYYVGPGFVLQGEATSYIQLTAPGDIVVGEAFTVAAVAFDQYANLAAPGSAGTVHLRSTVPAQYVSGLPETFDFAAAGVSTTGFTVTYTGPEASGFQQIYDLDGGGPPVFTHYSRVHETAPVFRRYFGDTHFHTGSGNENRWNPRGGGDHIGGFTYVDQAYHYVRDVARLDFASASEHAGLLMTDAGWDAVQEVTENCNDPHVFTTFRAFEWNWPAVPYAHQIVVYRGAQGARVSAETHPSYPELIDVLEDQPDVMVIPHPKHGSRPFEISAIDERFARLYEFHSFWAAEDGPLSDKPQVYELGIDEATGKTLQYAWGNVIGLDNRVKRRHHVGVIASSDNHRQTPGFNAYTKHTEHEGSLAVVLAESNTRDDLWVAMHDRRTYGTTGSRIYAHLVAVDNAQTYWPGQGFIPQQAVRTFIVQAAGTAPLEEVALVKFDPATGNFDEATVTAAGFTGPDGVNAQPQTFSGDGDTYEGTFTDNNPLHAVEETLYYLRIKEQGVLTVDTSELRPGRVAITSPIWVAVTDRNANGIPDGLDASNGICGPFAGDADHDDDTDFLDFAVFQECYGANPLVDFCACEMDMDTNGVIDVTDYLAFAAGFDGPGGLGEGLDGGEGFSPLAAGPDGGSDDSAQSQPDPAPPPAHATIELRPMGGGAAVTTLAAHTRYEVHYAANDLTAVNYFVMFGVTDSPETGLSAAAQATSGDWAGAPWFVFWDIVADGLEPVRHASMPPGFARYQVTESEYPSAGPEGTEDDVLPTAGPSGLLCTITTGEAGELYLELYLALLDPVTDSCEEAYGLAHFNVIDTADAE